MNDISTFAKSEQDSYLGFKDVGSSKNDQRSGADFLNQLDSAHKLAEPVNKNDTKLEVEESVSNSAYKDFKVDDTPSEKVTDETTPLSSDSLLAQINSAHTIDTSVKKHIDVNTRLIDSDLVKHNKPVDAITPIVVAPQNIKQSEAESELATNTRDVFGGVTSSAVSVSADLPSSTSLKDVETKDSQRQAPQPTSPDAKSSIELNDIKHHKNLVAKAIDVELTPIVNIKPDERIGPIINKPEMSVSKAEVDFKFTATKDNIENEPTTMKQTANEHVSNIAKPTAGQGMLTPGAEASTTKLASNITPLDDAKTIINKGVSDDDVMVKTTNSSQLEIAKNSALGVLLSGDISSIKSDKLLVSLTSEQREKLNIQTQITDKKSNNITALKQMLNEFLADNEKSSSVKSKSLFSVEISALTMSEKQTLHTQLSHYIKNEQPQGKELASLKQVISDLGASMNSEQVLASKTKPVTFVAAETPNTVYDPQKQSAKSLVNESNNQPDKLITHPLSDEELTKQLDTLQKESLRGNNAEQLTPRAAQLFTQITSMLNAQQTNALSYDTLSYEQAIIETQSLQSQQLHNATPVKQVSIDPGLTQALNIIKSDAAKMLQERVSSMLSINNKEAEIRLDPPEMGSMQIRIRSDAEQAQINFVVQNQQAKEALEQSLPRLREMLAQQGIELGESSISYGQSGGDETEQGEDASQGNLANKDLVDGQSDEQTDHELQRSGQQTSSSIDYYA
jgi:flagellar hook-length control protein FliK